MMASVDVIIPNYQYGRYLRQCVESVLTQEHTDLRVLIIDNASTDNSIEVARQLRDENPRVEIIAHKKNLGGHASYNEGIDRAVADYMTYLCADDIMAPGFLSSAVSILEQNRDVVFCLGCETFYVEGEDFPILGRQPAELGWQLVEGSDFIESICRRPSAFPAVVRTSVQKETGYYCPELFLSDDMEMLLRLALHGRVARTTAIIGIRRIHDSNLSVQKWTERDLAIRDWERVFQTFFAGEGGALHNARRLHNIAKEFLAARAYWWAVGDLLIHKRRDAGLRLLSSALRLRPRMAIIPPVSFALQAEQPLRRVTEALGVPSAWLGKASKASTLPRR